MLERTLVQSTGFRNVGAEGARTGFEFRLRLPSYRGLRASLVDGVDVTVNGERFSCEDNRYALADRELSIGQLRDAVDLRWPLGETCVVRVARPGGLATGTHQITVGIRIRQSYIPIEFQPSVFTETRYATVVQP
ncbi:C-glycoside deglycosidase beta subunit domain-containing protein [Massilia sp. LjRoot122]|uniref:C-glycoside deglycosidase beta subunit domain-containing protein n=1 Tax=Massilia sp. LjRoot122 TaxID=3342257 RepID=UPI003ED0C73C